MKKLLSYLMASFVSIVAILVVQSQGSEVMAASIPTIDDVPMFHSQNTLDFSVHKLLTLSVSSPDGISESVSFEANKYYVVENDRAFYEEYTINSTGSTATKDFREFYSNIEVIGVKDTLLYFYVDSDYSYEFAMTQVTGGYPISTYLHFYVVIYPNSAEVSIDGFPSFTEDNYQMQIVNEYTRVDNEPAEYVEDFTFIEGYIYAFPEGWREGFVNIHATGGVQGDADYRSAISNNMEFVGYDFPETASSNPLFAELKVYEFALCKSTFDVELHFRVNQSANHGSWPNLHVVTSIEPFEISQPGPAYEWINVSSDFEVESVSQGTTYAFDSKSEVVLEHGKYLIILGDFVHMGTEFSWDQPGVLGYTNPNSELTIADPFSWPIEAASTHPKQAHLYDIQTDSFRALFNSDSSYMKQFQVFKMIEDEIPPQFNHQGTYVYTMNYDAPESLDDLLALIRATDDKSGDITDRIEVTSDEFTGTPFTLGMFEVVLSVADNAGNTTTLLLVIYVVDKTAPVITGKTVFNVSNQTKMNIDNFRFIYGTEYSISDNFDGAIIVNNALQVLEDNYSANYNVAGAYTIVLSAEDSSGNAGLLVVTINVGDTIAPVLFGTSTFKLSTDVLIGINDFLKFIVAIDETDGDLTSEIVILSDGFTGHGNLPGTYKIVFAVSDSAGNVTTKDIFAIVVDHIPPVFIVDELFVFVSAELILDETDFILLIKHLADVTTGQVNISVDLTAYEGNEQIPGIYSIPFAMVSSSGETVFEIIKLEVLALEVPEDELPGAENDNEYFKWIRENIFDKLKIEEHISFDVFFWAGHAIVAALGVMLLIIIFSPRTKKNRRRK